MSPTFRLGRVFGIELAANWSVAFIAFLLMWGLAVNVLPDANPGQPVAAYWMVAVVAALAFFVALLLHELSHSLMARRHGVEVRRITLWLLGGVSQLEGSSPDAHAELQIAAVGPLTSLALGLLAGGLALVAHLSSALGLLAAALWWLALVNLVLGVFNLVPAFPLDGGRVLRAALWSRWRDEARATAVAGGIGRGFGLALVAGGLALLVFGQPVDGIWFALIGWFLVAASRAEAEVSGSRQALSGLTVGDVMSPHPIVVPASLPVPDLIDSYLLRLPHSSYPVVSEPGGELTGLVCLDDIRGHRGDRRPGATAGQIARGLDQVVLCHPDEVASDLVTPLSQPGRSRALVLESGRLVGLVTHADLLRAMSRHGEPALGRSDLRQAFEAGAAPRTRTGRRAT
jgi:Zn-dependent protease/CBS domain-containing protein